MFITYNQDDLGCAKEVLQALKNAGFSHDAIRTHLQQQERKMFLEELTNLEKIYTEAIESDKEEMDSLIPYIVHHLKCFIKTYEQLKDNKDKLSALKQKLSEEFGDDNDD